MSRSVRRAYGLGDIAASVGAQAIGDSLREMLSEDAPVDDGAERESEDVGPCGPGAHSALEPEDSSGALPDVLFASPVDAPPLGAPAPKALDDAATLLMTKLPANIKVFIEEQSRVYSGYPPWVFILGAVLRQFEISQLQAPILDPSWLREFSSLVPPTGQAICKHCGTTFKEQKYKQKYCSNECGMRAEAIKSRAEAEASRRRREAEREKALAAQMLI